MTSQPAFFDEVPPLAMRDPLALALGAAPDGGLISYTYGDVVKLAGHSCPTVAGAFLSTAKALRLLYPDSVPVRGEIVVEVHEPQSAGVAGVVGAVASMLTGAAGEGGFKGLGGRFARRELLHFGVPMEGDLRFTRVDTGESVEVAYSAESVRRPDELGRLMQGALGPAADDGTRAAFGAAWQEWVRRILVEHGDDPAVVRVIPRDPALRVS